MTTLLTDDNGTTRPMTETEIAALKAIQAEAAEQAQAKEAQKIARENAIEKLTNLGLSDNEIAALFGA